MIEIFLRSNINMVFFRNLLDCDVFSKSDPMCVVFMKTPETTKWVEICRTECINNSLNPNFVTKVIRLFIDKKFK